MKPKLNLEDFQTAAQLLNCEIFAIQAVAEVESRKSGFLPDGRLVILFERHQFHKFSGGKFSAQHPAISNPTAGGYVGGAGEWLRYEDAMKLDRRAALMSASYGLFQIMGFNHKLCGYATVEGFVAAMDEGEGEQLKAFCRFLQSAALDDELRDKQWRAFARGYNGPAYRKNNYDVKMAAAYLKFRGRAPMDRTQVTPAPLPEEEQAAPSLPPVPPVEPERDWPKEIKEKLGETKSVTDDATSTVESVKGFFGKLGKRSDSIKAFRIVMGMKGAAAAAMLGGFWEANKLVIWASAGVIVLFAILYFLRQWHLGVVRERK